MSKLNKTAVIIVAAGLGKRIDGDIPKQYIKLGNKTILQLTLEKFIESTKIDLIQVVINPNFKENYDKVLSKLRADKILPFVEGGNTRQESVKNGLAALENKGLSKVLVHDAARPFVSTSTIDELIDMLDEHDAVDLCTQISDTIRKANSLETVDRDHLLSVQTPQSFRYDVLLELHNNADGNSFTDCISLAEINKNLDIVTLIGSSDNFKITNNSDLRRAHLMVEKDYEIRMGHGYDTHKLEDGNPEGVIMLGGLKVPFTKKIIAHSDGDVILHALMDAILGALGKGDIGKIFPPEDDKWKNADSKHLLKIINKFINEVNCSITNIDITLIAESPKISGIRRMMTDKISHVLGIDSNRVNIKATTNEKMGFIGRQEGIAAMATCVLKLFQKV